MIRMYARNRVRDFDVWLDVFKSQLGTDSGLELEHMDRDRDDPNNVFFVLRVTDPVKAEAHVTSPEAAEIGERSGVIDGELHYTESVDL